MKMLISKGADMNSQCHGDLTPLHIAAREGHLECLELLLQSGADFTATDVNGHTALETAKLWGKRECARRLAAVQWTSEKTKQINEMIVKTIRKVYADRHRKGIEDNERFWEANLSFQKWIKSKGFSVMENITMPENCQQRLAAQLSTPDPICEACKIPQDPPDLQTALHQAKRKPIEVSFRPERQHYPTSYLLSGIQPKEKSRPQRKSPSKRIKCKSRVIKVDNGSVRETVVESDSQEQPIETTIRLKEEACNSIPLTKSKSMESLTNRQSLESETTLKAKSLSILEDSTISKYKIIRKDKTTVGPPSLLFQATQSLSDIHSKTCEAWGRRPIHQPNAFIWVPQQQLGHVSKVMPKLVIEPRPLHSRWTTDLITLPNCRPREVKLGEDSNTISRYRGCKGGL